MSVGSQSILPCLCLSTLGQRLLCKFNLILMRREPSALTWILIATMLARALRHRHRRTGTIDLAAAATCNGDDLDVNITGGDNPFDITGTGPTLPQNGVPIGVTTLTGPGSWGRGDRHRDDRRSGKRQPGHYTCPPPVIVGGGSGGGGSASSCNLVIDVEADHEVVTPGDRVMWTVRVTNSGSAECQGVQDLRHDAG